MSTFYNMKYNVGLFRKLWMKSSDYFVFMGMEEI